jgi:hypothetical protein
MACAATARGDQMLCSLCGVQWDRSDPEPPTCRRQADKGVVLKPAEVKALKQCAADWQPIRRRKRGGQGGGGFGRKGEPKIPYHVAKVLVTFHLAFISQFQSLRATPYGVQWLASNAKR